MSPDYTISTASSTTGKRRLEFSEQRVDD